MKTSIRKAKTNLFTNNIFTYSFRRLLFSVISSIDTRGLLLPIVTLLLTYGLRSSLIVSRVNLYLEALYFILIVASATTAAPH